MMFLMSQLKFIVIVTLMVLTKNADAGCPLDKIVSNGLVTHWLDEYRAAYVCKSGYTANGTSGISICQDEDWVESTPCEDCTNEDQVEQLGLYSDDEINFVFSSQQQCYQKCLDLGCWNYMYYRVGGQCHLNYGIGPSPSISLEACRMSCLVHTYCKAIQKLGNQCFLYSRVFSSYTEEEATVATSCL